jgi:hypothetical protein
MNMLESLQVASESTKCETVRVKFKIQWRPQGVEGPRNMKYLLRKATSNKWSQPKRESMWAENRKPIGVKLPKSLGAQIHLSEVPCIESDCPTGVWSCLGPVPPFFDSIIPF